MGKETTNTPHPLPHPPPLQHRGLVLADPYRKHMRILFHLGNTAAGKDVLSGKLSVEDCIKLSDVTKYTG